MILILINDIHTLNIVIYILSKFQTCFIENENISEAESNFIKYQKKIKLIIIDTDSDYKNKFTNYLYKMGKYKPYIIFIGCINKHLFVKKNRYVMELIRMNKSCYMHKPIDKIKLLHAIQRGNIQKMEDITYKKKKKLLQIL